MNNSLVQTHKCSISIMGLQNQKQKLLTCFFNLFLVGLLKKYPDFSIFRSQKLTKLKVERSLPFYPSCAFYNCVIYSSIIHGFFIQSAWIFMIALTYSNTHFLTLIDKEEAENQRQSLMIRRTAIGKAGKTAVLPIFG